MKLLIIGSATRTLRAQELLLHQGISARIMRLDNPMEGCVRALRVEDGQVERARAVLAEGGISLRRVEEWKR